jgi:HK97 family phage major capsid protein/HK97 family phage prohead protease
MGAMTVPYKPTSGMVEEAKRGLEWRREHGRGGTEVGIARARDIANGKNLSDDTVKRMFSFFSRHEVDKQAEGFSPGEDGYPSNGRIAWALWGGDAGFSWSRRISEAMKKDEKRAAPDALSVGDFVSWDSSGGTARGRIERIERDGTINVPDADFTVTGTAEDPAALIRIYREGEATDTLVGHRFSTLRKISDIRGDKEYDEKEERHIQSIQETEDAYIITYGKATPDREYDEDDEMEMERDNFDRSTLTFRAVAVEATEEDDRRVRMSLSSEEPVERNFGMEVLEHTEEAIDMSRIASGNAPLLKDHDMTKQIGIVEEAYLDRAERKLRAVVRFGKNPLAREVYEDVKDGTVRNVSIGYIIKNMEQRNGDGTVVVNQWIPYEASIVAVPADNVGAGIGRNANFVETTEVVKDVKMTEVNTDEIRLEAAEAAKREFQKNAQEITALAVKHNKRDLADDAIAKGMSINEFRGILLDALPEGKPLEQSAGAVEMNAKETREYSFMKAVRGLVNGSGLNGLEREVSDEIAKRQGREARGFYAPDSFWTGKRDLTVGTDSAGGFLKPTDHLGDQFIDALRSRLVLNQLGTRFMSGLRGDVAIPKLSGGVSAGFVAENGATSEVNATFAQVTMSPKSLGAFTDVSRLLMIQSDPSVEQIVRDDLLNAIAQKIEDVAIEGGASNEPTGITQTTGIGSVAIGTNGGAATWGKVVDLIKEVEQDNAAIGEINFLTNSKVKAHLSQTAKVSSTDSVMILNDPWTSLYGYNMAVTNNVPSDLTKGTGTGLSALIAGDFSQLMIGLFSTSDVLVDPYTGGSSGAVRIRVMQEVDVAVRHAQSFAACLDINA